VRASRQTDSLAALPDMRRESHEVLSSLLSGLSLEDEPEAGHEVLSRKRKSFAWDPETSTLQEDARSLSEISLWTEGGTSTLAEDEDRMVDESDSEPFYEAQDFAAASTAAPILETNDGSDDFSDSSKRFSEDNVVFRGGRRAAGVLGVMPEGAAYQTQEFEAEEPRGRSLSSPRHEPVEPRDIQTQPKVRWYAKELQTLLGDARHAHFRSYFNGIGSEGFRMPGTADLEREFPGVDFTVS